MCRSDFYLTFYWDIFYVLYNKLQPCLNCLGEEMKKIVVLQDISKDKINKYLGYMKSTYWVVCFALMGVVACKNDRKQVMPFVGHWNLTYGEINGRPAPSLENIYFEFGIDSIKTNFTMTEQDESGTFRIKEDRIIQNTLEPIEYDIEEMTDSTLQMTTALRGLDFKLFLKKDGQ